MKVWMLSSAKESRVFTSAEAAVKWMHDTYPKLTRISNTFFHGESHTLLHKEPFEWPLEESSPWLKYHSKPPILTI